MSRKELSLTITLCLLIVVSVVLSGMLIDGSSLAAPAPSPSLPALLTTPASLPRLRPSPTATPAIQARPTNAALKRPTATLPPTRIATPVPPTAIPSPSPTATISSISSVVRSNRENKWLRSERFILIDQDTQLIHIYENGVEIQTLPCSTGLPTADKFTPAWQGWVGDYYGTFFSFGTYSDNAWYLFKASGDILIHGAPYIYANGKKIYQELEALGQQPASHGCIRIHPDDARWFTAWNPKGVPIVITPWSGKIAK
jgi:lipoprotein-anchoring transpeptidase ErfK/SrfK